MVNLYRDWQLYKQTIGRLQEFIDETRRKQNVLNGKDHSTFLSGMGVAGKEISRRPFECARMCCSISNIGIEYRRSLINYLVYRTSVQIEFEWH